MTVPQSLLGGLHRADGSADYTRHGYRILCAVNGPVEVQRRDEIPDEAALEINVRPANSIGGPKERHLETLLHSTLRHVILTYMHPRSLIQITLQILATPEGYSDLRQSSHLAPLPALINATTLALLSASLPLQTTPTAISIALTSTNELIPDPSPAQQRKAKSIHVFAFQSDGRLLLAESEGRFEIEEWERAEGRARGICLGTPTDLGTEAGEGSDVEMDDEEGGVALGVSEGNASRGKNGVSGGLLGEVRGIVAESVGREMAWRDR